MVVGALATISVAVVLASAAVRATAVPVVGGGGSRGSGWGSDGGGWWRWWWVVDVALAVADRRWLWWIGGRVSRCSGGGGV